MKHARVILVGVLALALQGAANAQIYETEDAEGVPDFSDTPSQGAEVVDLPATNVMEAPAVGEAAPPAEDGAAPLPGESTAGGSGREEGDPGEVYYGGDDEDDPRAQRRIDEDRVDNALPGNPGPGVGAPGPGIEPGAGEVGRDAVHHEARGHR